MSAEAQGEAAAGELVAVVIPAFNAERWIDETLRSVRAQTHRALEIVVVDDGSTDGTCGIVERHAALDGRIRLIRQANAGVAAARNRGVAETCADLIAPVDADDLWAPTKIERQLARLRALGDGVGLVYTRFALIDADSRIIHVDRRRGVEGEALIPMCLTNVVGNGSSPLMRRSVMLEAGGYDPGLRAADAQGCEDYKLYFAIAERSRFGFVDECLTGYRDLPDNMSSQLGRMLRSRDLCTDEFRSRHPRQARLFDRGRMRLLRFNLARALRARRGGEARAALSEMFGSHPIWAAAEIATLAFKVMRSKTSRWASTGADGLGTRFPIGVP
jgi:glycosyltransferase involved in cell wall biosynthesis